jgi:alpha-methylacyl-CoA racemase
MSQFRTPSGPLTGLRVIEFAGMGPAPFCAMLLSDLGAEVIRIDRPGGSETPIPTHLDVLARGRRSIAINLKHPEAVQTCLHLIERADAVLEGFRPGVMERLGLGPDACLQRNPKLVFGRMTGWGQTGSFAQLAGHDLNYISITGIAHVIGRRDQPVPPLNLTGDFGGGALYLAFGVVSALLHVQRGGAGQVVDCAMTDGAASLMTSIYMMKACGLWSDQREDNNLDGGAHFYNMYRCADEKWVSVAAIEPKFYEVLLAKTGLDDPGLQGLNDKTRWPAKRSELARIFATKTRADWCEIMRGADACFAPVLDLSEAPSHPHNVERRAFETQYGVLQPAPTPKFSQTPGAIQGPPPAPGQHGREILADWGVSVEMVDGLIATGVVVESQPRA